LAEYLEDVDEFVSELWMVGDMQSDLEAGRSVRARVIMISAHGTGVNSDAQKTEESLLGAVMYITAH
jgi:histidinol phosphatase-like enzyme